jgi:hypothetical protein
MKWFRSNPKIWGTVVLVVAGGLALAGMDAAASPPRPWLTGWLAYSLLLGAAAVCLGMVLRIMKATQQVTRAALAAFLLRLVVGLALMILLPIAGYQTNIVTRAGYVFPDAYYRDLDAYQLADYGKPIINAFSGDLSSGDQYGGMLALSSAVYRYISPDAHRPYLIIILTALMAGLGTFFLWGACREWFGETAALTAAWIFAVYPESVLLGSSQMRESFVMAGAAIAFFSLTQMTTRISTKKLPWQGWLATAAVILFLFQPPVGLVVFITLFIALILDPNRQLSWKKILLFIGILAGGMAIVFLIWANLPVLKGVQPARILFAWLQHNFNFQTFLSIRSSGQMQNLTRTAGALTKLFIVLGYGTAQPVLPAALVVPSGSWIWWLVNVFRSLGWYLLAPFLVYTLFTSLRARGELRRFQLFWLSLLVWIWIFVSAANAGADLWDTPRYRTILLVFEAALAAWGIDWARKKRDVWLIWWLLVELACVLVFTYWYLGREGWVVLYMGIRPTIALAAFLSVLILFAGWLLDWRKSKR